MEKISVIIPVYKVEKYLDKCVKSVASQTYKNLEIILVDDGSPDACPQMCDDWAKKDKRIKVIHKQNGGLSDARNAGLDIATGEYIGFVDSDDYIEKEMYEKMVAFLENNCLDIAYAGYKMIYPNKIVYVDENVSEVNSGNIFSKYLAQRHNYKKDRLITKGVLATVWRGLYKKNVFDKTRFIYGMFCEDIVFHVMLFKNNNYKIAFLNDYLYNYVQRENSILSAHTEQKVIKKLEFIKTIIPLLNGEVSNKELLAYEFMLYKSLIYDLLLVQNLSVFEKYKEGILYLKTKTGYSFFNKQCGFKAKIMNWLVYHSKYRIIRKLLKNKGN